MALVSRIVMVGQCISAIVASWRHGTSFHRSVLPTPVSHVWRLGMPSLNFTEAPPHHYSLGKINVITQLSASKCAVIEAVSDIVRAPDQSPLLPLWVQYVQLAALHEISRLVHNDISHEALVSAKQEYDRNWHCCRRRDLSGWPICCGQDPRSEGSRSTR